MADELITKKITEVQNFTNGDLGTIIQVQGDEIGQTNVGTLKQDITNSVVDDLITKGIGSVIPVNLSTLAPEKEGIFQPTEIGIYENFGGLELTEQELENNIVYFYYLDGIFSKQSKGVLTVDEINSDGENAVNGKAVFDYTNQTINTISELRLFNGKDGQVITLLGYYEKGDKEPLNYKWTSEQGVDDGGSVINTEFGSWKAIFNDYVDVRDFGAIGDGIYDNTSIFQKTVNKFYLITISDGIYASDTIYLRDEVQIQGKNCTVLRITPNISVIDINDAKNIKISGLFFDGNSNNLSKDSVYNNVEISCNGRYIEIVNCNFKNLLGPAIAGSRGRNVTIRDIIVYDIAETDGRGVYFSSLTSQDILIDNLLALNPTNSTDSFAIKLRSGVSNVQVVNSKCFNVGRFMSIEAVSSSTPYPNNNIVISNCYGEVMFNAILISTQDPDQAINSNITISNCTFTNVLDGYAPIAMSWNSMTSVRDVTITDVTFNFFRASININGSLSNPIENVYIKNVRCINSNDYETSSMTLQNCRNVLIESSYFEVNNSNSSLINIYDECYDVNISSSKFHAVGNPTSGIRLRPNALNSGNINLDNISFINLSRLFTGTDTGIKNGMLKISNSIITTTISDNASGFDSAIIYSNTVRNNRFRNKIDINSSDIVRPQQGEFYYNTETGLKIRVDNVWEPALKPASTTVKGLVNQSASVENITTSDATDLATAITLVNELKQKLNAKLQADRDSGQQSP